MSGREHEKLGGTCGDVKSNLLVFNIQRKMGRPEQYGKTTSKKRSNPGSFDGSEHSLFFSAGAIALGAFTLTGFRKIYGAFFICGFS